MPANAPGHRADRSRSPQRCPLPVTPDGRTRSSRNALKHGLAALHHFMLKDEAPSELEELTARLLAECEIGARLVKRMAIFDLKRFNPIRGYRAQQGRELSRCLKEPRLLRRAAPTECVLPDRPAAWSDELPHDTPEPEPRAHGVSDACRARSNPRFANHTPPTAPCARTNPSRRRSPTATSAGGWRPWPASGSPPDSRSGDRSTLAVPVPPKAPLVTQRFHLLCCQSWVYSRLAKPIDHKHLREMKCQTNSVYSLCRCP